MVSAIRCTLCACGLVALATTAATDLAAQNTTSSARSWSFSGGLSWLELNGERRLVRGDRKVVTTNAEGGVAPFLEASFPLNDRYSLTFAATRVESRYTHNETFTNGLSVETTDDLTLGMIAAGVKRTWGRSGALKLNVNAHLAFLLYNDRLELLSEQQLPADPSTIEATPFNLSVLNSFGGGLGIGVEAPLADSGLFLSAGARLTLGFMPADIINDPEDPEDGHDVNSPMHPLSIGLGVGYRLGG